MATLLIRNASILTLDSEARFIECGYLRVEDRRIVQVAPGDPPASAALRADQEIDATGMLATPGLVNAHTHSQSATLPGFGDRLSHPAFMWLTQAHTARRTPDEIRLAVLLTAWAALGSGTTAIVDHFPGQRFHAQDVDAVMRAWEETGMRTVLGLRFYDEQFSDIFPPAGVIPESLMGKLRGSDLLQPQPLEEFSELARDAMMAWHGKHGRLAVYPAPSNPDRCSDAALLRCAELAQSHDSGIHTHLLETARQAEIARERYGCSSLQRLEHLGVLSDRWSCAHCCWLNPQDIALMARRQAVAVLNPESNARLGTGVAPVPALMDAGVRLALGTDGAGANDNLSMQEAMRAAADLHRVGVSRSRWMTGRQALGFATTGGAQVLRRDDIGQLAPGSVADVVLYRMDSPVWTPLNNAVDQLVFSETGSNVDTVLVDGEVLMRGGRPMRFDPQALRHEIIDMTRAIKLRNADLFTVAQAVARAIP